MTRRVAILLALLPFATLARTVTTLDGGWTADGVAVDVPHTWNAVDAADGEGRAPDWAKVGYSSGATSYVRKAVLYRRTLPDPKPGKRYFLKCAGASVKCVTRVNGREVGRHTGAFTAFCHEATAALKPTGNILEMTVDNRLDPDVQPIHADFSVMGGLYRTPEWIETGSVAIDPVTDGASGVVLEPDAKTGDVIARVSVLGGTNEVQRFHFDNPKLWSPETPNLYDLVVRVRQNGAEDAVAVRFGFRTIEFRADGFYLNGVKRKIRGVCRHQDREGRGWCRSREDEADDVRWIKRMGADGVRTSHYPQSPAFYDLCDEQGLLVWTEAPNVNGLTFTETARQNELREAREMVMQHRNHPSIFAWGIYNELYNMQMTEAPEPRMRALKEYVNALDPSRPVTAASHVPYKTELCSIPDILGFNLYPGWYGGKSEDMGKVIDSAFAQNPTRKTASVSEYGCSGCVTQHADPTFRLPKTETCFHPEEYQARHHWANYRGIAADGRVWGSFLWVMFDAASDAKREGERMGLNDKGMVTWDRSTAKDAYFFYKANWNAEPLVHLVGSRRTETTDETSTVMAFSNVGPVRLFLNGEPYGEQTPDAVKTVIWENVPLRIGLNEIEIRAGAFRKTARWTRRPPEIDLSGVWRVAGRELSGEVRLPGTLAEAGLGHRWTRAEFERTLDKPQSCALTRERQHLGPATYARTFAVGAEDAAHDLELFLERVLWTSSVKVDGREVGGTVDSLATPHVHPLGRLSAGEHRLEITVDNSPRYGFSRHSHAYGPSMQSVWHGVLGQVRIRRANPLDVVRVKAAADGRLTLLGVPDGLEVAATVEGLDPERGERPELWSEQNPRLYTVTLAGGGFTRRLKVGFRTFSAGRHSIRLNGHDIFTRANVENCNFAKMGQPWMTKAEWTRMFRTLKEEDGVNTFRFHTWCPPEAAFAAADEVGVYLQPEAGVWTDAWMCPEPDAVGYGKPVDGFVRRELRAIADAYGHHPSFLSLCAGNELGTSQWDEADRIVREMKAYDDRFLHYYCSARTVVPEDEITLTHRDQVRKVTIRERLFPKTDWDYEADYAKLDRPTVAHEIGQWPVYPEFDGLLAKFDGVLRPWNLERLRDRAEREGTRRFEKEYHAASAALSRLIYKEEVESFLRTPSCAGLQLLSVQDYTGQGEALVGWRDPFYALKTAYADKPAFNTVWGERNFLARFGKFDWTVGETFRAKLLFRNLSDRTVSAGTRWTWTCAGRSGEVVSAADIAPGALAEVGAVAVRVTEAMTSAKQTLAFGSNRWNFWAYPQEGTAAWPDGVTVTDDFGTMSAALADGKTVLYTGRSRETSRGTFKPVYWSSNWFPARDPLKATLGTWFDAEHPAFDGFVTDDFTDWQWYYLCQGAKIHRLTGLPEDFLPIGLSVNDLHFSLFSATLFELKVGGGRLLVCGYDLEQDRPAARRLRSSLSRYLAAEPAPKTARVPLDWLVQNFAPRQEEKAPDGSVVYACMTNWTARTFAKEIRLDEPVTGTVEITFDNPEGAFRTGRGLIDGHVFEISSEKGLQTVRVGVIREDSLDGKLEFRAQCMSGDNLIVRSIRVLQAE